MSRAGYIAAPSPVSVIDELRRAIAEQREIIADLSAQLEDGSCRSRKERDEENARLRRELATVERGHSIASITSALYRSGMTQEQVDAFMVELGADHGPVDRERCRTARRITYRGETHTIGGWADRLGISEWTLRYRLSAGWTEHQALGKKPRRAGARTHRGGA